MFAAAGVDPADDGSKVAIAAQARRWRFGHPTPADGVRHDAVRAAASWLDEHADVVLGTPTPSPTVRAVVAVEVHEAFLRPAAGSGQLEVEAEPEPAAVRVVLARRSARHREATGV